MNPSPTSAAPQSASLLDQAQQAFTQGTMGELLSKVPTSLKTASDKTVSSFNKLSTTQKVVGGTLLALGLTLLATRPKGSKAARKAAVLDELLLFVNDRIEGYKRAVAETKDAQLRGYYQQLVGQSQQFASGLNKYLTQAGGERETGTTLKGKLYRKLMDAQAVVSARDEKAILAANVYGERWAIKAYKKALRKSVIKGELREDIKRQFATSKQTYKRLKQLTASQQAG